MKLKILLLTIALTCCFSCNNDDDGNKIPECLQTIIEDVEGPDSPSLIVKIERYLYNGEEVFFMSMDQNIDDRIDTVRNLNCEVICVFGGIMGLNTCPDFSVNADFIEVVWER